MAAVKLDKTSPLYPTPYTMEHVAAMQALERGDADSVQQKLALGWIINDACRTYDNTLHSGGEEGRRDSDIAGGKRFVGLELVKLIKINLLRMKETPNG